MDYNPGGVVIFPKSMRKLKSLFMTAVICLSVLKGVSREKKLY